MKRDKFETMSVKVTRDEKPSTSIVGCCQSSSTTPENSIVDYIEEDLESPNNNTLFHATDVMDNVNGEKLALAETTKAAVDIIAKKKASIDFTFPKRPKVDIEFQNVKYTVKKFSLKNRAFGEYLKNKE